MSEQVKEITTLPSRCTICNETAGGTDMDLSKGVDRARMFQWGSHDPDFFVLFCQQCWKKIRLAVRRAEETRND